MANGAGNDKSQIRGPVISVGVVRPERAVLQPGTQALAAHAVRANPTVSLWFSPRQDHAADELAAFANRDVAHRLLGEQAHGPALPD